MPKVLPALIAEVIGTFALCFIGILAIHQKADIGLLGVALAHGLILAIAISIFGATSGGHHNPAVTIGLLVGGAIKPPLAAMYIAAQIVGGIVAGVLVIAIFGQTAPVSVGGGQAAHFGAEIVTLGTPQLATKGWSIFGGCLAELIATFLLVTAVWGTAVDPRAPKIGGFGIGLTVAADILAIGTLTGGAMNPARAFGPAVAASIGGADYVWATHWIYWVGPILGGILASLVYKNFIWPKNRD